jgi:hypothetical protein
MLSVDASLENSRSARDGANNTSIWTRFEKICPSTLFIKEPKSSAIALDFVSLTGFQCDIQMTFMRKVYIFAFFFGKKWCSCNFKRSNDLTSPLLTNHHLLEKLGIGLQVIAINTIICPGAVQLNFLFNTPTFNTSTFLYQKPKTNSHEADPSPIPGHFGPFYGSFFICSTQHQHQCTSQQCSFST